MTCRVTQEACQGVSESRPYGFDLTAFCTRFRQPGVIYPDNVSARPPAATGFEYEAIEGGQTSKKNPFAFSLTLAEEKVDGSVTWATRDISNASLERTIVSVEWVVDDAAVVFSDETLVNTEGRMLVGAVISGGVAETTYLVIARVTFTDGATMTVEDFGINLEIH